MTTSRASYHADAPWGRQRIARAQIVALVVAAVAPSVRETFYALGRRY